MLNVSNAFNWPGDWNLLQQLWQNLNNEGCPDDAAAVRQARNEACYAEPGTPTNPLIEWTMSDDWTEIPPGRPQTAIHGELETKS